MTETEIKALIRKENSRAMLFSMALALVAAFLASGTTVFLLEQHEETEGEHASKEVPSEVGPNSVSEISPSNTQSISVTNQPVIESQPETISSHSRSLVSGSSVAGGSSGLLAPRKVLIKVRERDWANTADGLRPRLAGDIVLAEGDPSSFMVEVWINALVDGEKIGFSAWRSLLGQFGLQTVDGCAFLGVFDGEIGKAVAVFLDVLRRGLEPFAQLERFGFADGACWG